MNVIDRLKLAFSSKAMSEHIKNESGHVETFLGGGDMAGDNVDTMTALKYNAFFACIRVLAETFTSVPIFEYKKKSDGDRDATDQTGLLDLLKYQPNSEMDAYTFYELGMMQLNTTGNYVCKRATKLGEITALWPCDFNGIKVERNSDTNRLEYRIDQKDREPIIRTKDKLFHVMGLTIDGEKGMNILEMMADSITLGLSYQMFSTKFFQNGATPSGVFEKEGWLTDEMFKDFYKRLKTEYMGLKNSGNPMLLEHDLKYKPLTITPVDAQLTESKKLAVEEVCRFLRVPLHLVQNLDKATNNNIEHQSLEFIMYTMLPWFKRWESPINNQLLTVDQRKAGYFFEYNMAGLLRGDMESMAKAFATGRQWGWLSVNDIRRLLNMNKVENGDIYLQPMNMIEAGTVVEPKQTVVDDKAVENMMKLIMKSQEKELVSD